MFFRITCLHATAASAGSLCCRQVMISGFLFCLLLLLTKLLLLPFFLLLLWLSTACALRHPVVLLFVFHCVYPLVVAAMHRQSNERCGARDVVVMPVRNQRLTAESAIVTTTNRVEKMARDRDDRKKRGELRRCSSSSSSKLSPPLWPLPPWPPAAAVAANAVAVAVVVPMIPAATRRSSEGASTSLAHGPRRQRRIAQ